MVKKENIIKQIKNFSVLCSEEISIKYVYLFGSVAENRANEYSDIDIAIVSNNFVGKRYLDRKKLYKYILQTNSAFEVHPFKSEDFTNEDPFARRILETGIRIV